MSDIMTFITNAAIQRLARRGGVKRISGLVYDEIRGVMKTFLENIIKSSEIRMVSTKLNTIKVEHVLPSLDIAMYSSAISDFKCHLRDAKKDDALRDIRHFQKTGCLLLPRASFARVVKDIARGFKISDNIVHISSDAVLLLQYATEAHFVNLFANSMLVAIHADRTGILPTDIQICRQICNGAMEEGVKTQPIIQSVPTVDFSSGIKQCLKELRGYSSLSTDACSQINFIINTLCNMFVSQARSLATLNNSGTISSRNIESAVKEVLPSELAKHAVNVGMMFMNKKRKAVFPVSKVHILLQDYIKIHNVHKESGRTVLETGGSVANRVNKNTALYLTGVLEYITDELVDLSASSAMSDRRRRINARDLQVVFENDEELKMLKAKMGIDILGGGVMPKIHTRLIPKKK